MSHSNVAMLLQEETALRTLTADKDAAARAAEVLKAVAHPLRLRIIALLAEGEEHVGAIAERLGASQAIVSQQLRILRTHRLVAAERQGGLARYRLIEPNLRTLLDCLTKCSCF